MTESLETTSSHPAETSRRWIRRLVEFFWMPPAGDISELELWRERILAAILASGVVLFAVALFPTIAMLMGGGKLLLAAVDAGGMVMAVGLLILRGRISFSVRAGISLMVAYAIGVGVILSVGIVSGGPIWLFFFAVLAGVLLGFNGAFWALGLNAASICFFGWAGSSGVLPLGSAFQSALQAWVAVINFLFLNALCAISIAVLLRGLENFANRERSVASNLAQSKKRLSIIFENAGVGIAETSLDGTLSRVNRRFAELLGYAVSELEGSNVADISHPEDFPAEVVQVRNLVEQGGDFHVIEKRLRRRDGTWIWARATVSPVRDGGDRASHFIGVLEDITERKQALEALQESERRYRSILDAVPDAITITRLSDGRYLEVNPYFCQHSGYSRQEAIGRTPLELNLFVHPADRLHLVAEIEAKGEVNGLEIQYRHKDGMVLETLVSASRLQFGGEDCIVSVVSDVTERKRMARALDRSETRFRELAEMMPETLFETDAAGRLTFVNRQAMETFGYSAEDVAGGLMALDMLVPEDRGRAMENMLRVGSGHKPVLNEYQGLRKDGTRFPVMIRSAPVLQDGKLIGLRGFIINLTEKKKLEDRVRQSQKLDSIGTLAGGIAHDFNNILSAVLGYADLSLAELRPGDLVHGHLLKIRRAGERARDVVRQILTFSRKSDQEMVAVEIRPIIDEALKLIRATLPTTIEIRADLQSAATVLADPTQIHQVLMNLCTNAGHAMEAGGVLTVTLAEVETVLDDNADDACVCPCVRLTVADTGCGMTEAVLERIFDPFFTTKGVEKGTGLGLAVVHGIIKSHGGTISVASTPGQGTVFTIHLPILKGDACPHAHETEALPRGRESVLWIDDEDFQVELGSSILQRLGYRVEGRVRAEEALALFRSDPGRFDLVITDMTMPRMTGATLAREILAIRPDIPVILCTGYNEQISESQAMAMGIAAFAFKPVEFKQLAQLVRRVLDGVPARS